MALERRMARMTIRMAPICRSKEIVPREDPRRSLLYRSQASERVLSVYKDVKYM